MNLELTIIYKHKKIVIEGQNIIFKINKNHCDFWCDFKYDPTQNEFLKLSMDRRKRDRFEVFIKKYNDIYYPSYLNLSIPMYMDPYIFFIYDEFNEKRLLGV